MTDGGWVKSMRSDLQNPYLQKADALGLYDRFVRMAVREDTDAYCEKLGRVVHLKRGQLWISTNDLERFCTSRKRGRTILKNLEMGQLIGHEAGQGITVITICNYDEIQRPISEGAREGANQTANQGPGRGQQNGEDKEIKEIKNLGNVRARARDGEPQGPAPPDDPPDPIKFMMHSDWRMPSELYDELVQDFQPALGDGPFQRQVRRFIDKHVMQGTVENEAGFAELLRGWLRNANANRETKQISDASAPVESGTDPPNNDIAPGVELAKFERDVFTLYDEELSMTVGKRMSALERARFMPRLAELKHGKIASIGIERGHNWSADHVLKLLKIPKREAA